MRSAILLSLAVVWTAPHLCAQGAAGVIVKQRAKELRDQNNVRQGVPPPAPPARPGAPSAAATPTRPQTATANPRQQSVSRLQADLAALQGRRTVAPELKQRLARDLVAAASGPNKPAGASVAGFVEELAAVLAGQTFETAELARLAQDLDALFAGAQLPPARVQALLDDVQATLQVGGVRRPQAVSLVATLRRVTAEVRPPPAR